MVFSSSHIWMWELDHKENWALKNWCFWTVLLEILESHLDCKEIKPVNPKGNQSWIFIGRTDAEAQAPTCWPPDAKNWLIWKDPGAGKIEGRRGGHRGWDDRIVSLTQWTWVWANSGKWWRTRGAWWAAVRGLQRVGHVLTTEQQQKMIWCDAPF